MLRDFRPMNDELIAALSREGLTPSEPATWLDATDEIGAVVTDAGAFVGWFDAAWPGPGAPVQQMQDVVHVPTAMSSDLCEVLAQARRRHAAALRLCRYCRRQRTPGHMHSDDVCQRCAERHLGVVH